MATYLIMHPQVVVAEDLAETIREIDTTALIISTRTLPDASALLESTFEIGMAFVSATLQDLLASGLDGAVKARGGHLILLDEEAGHKDHTEMISKTGIRVLRQPFVPDMIRRMFHRDEPGAAEKPGVHDRSSSLTGSVGEAKNIAWLIADRTCASE